MTATDLELLRQFTRDHAQDAFTVLVKRHVNLVYSAALRQVRSPQLAEEVAQSVFADLARDAAKLKPDTVLVAWLHAVTRRTTVDVIRKESRRQLREQIAHEMNITNASDANWQQIEPLLDEAVAALDATDRAAILLRYFENQPLSAVGQQLGVSDDAAQKRVSRAVERLREFFDKRGVTVGASGLVVVISANAVQAAPAGLAITISSAAIVGTAVSTSTIVTATKTIAMTTLQKIIVTTTLAAAVGVGIYEAQQNSKLRDQVQTLQQQQAPLAQQLQQLQKDRDSATSRLASVVAELASTKKNPNEVLKLRGEVGMLRQENKNIVEKSAINKLTSDPASRKALRDQQKMGMTALYGDLVKRLNLAPELKDKFNDLMADSVMDNIDLITQVLHDGKSSAETTQIFSSMDGAFQGKLQALLGDDALAQYKEYSQNLGSTLTAAQCVGFMTGDTAAKEQKKNQLQKLVQLETAAVIKTAGLPADYQAVPMLNFVNIASEEQANQSLALLDNIYASVAANSSSFLSPEEIASLQTYRTNTVNASRSMLTMNRTLMAPISK